MDEPEYQAFLAAEVAATPTTETIEQAIADGQTRVTINSLKCCLIETAVVAFVDDGLDVPGLRYPSACGSAPPCLDAEYLTAYIDAPGVTGAESDPGAGAWRREASVRVSVGLCQPPTWTANNCGEEVVGSCEDPAQGTYAFEAQRVDEYLDALTRLSAGFKRCVCRGATGSLALSCSTPMLIGSETDCSQNRTVVSAIYRVAFG